MDLDAFNAEPADAAAQAVQACADIPAWVEAVVAGRPYADVARLLARADALARDWSDADVDRALGQHPRIGERGGLWERAILAPCTAADRASSSRTARPARSSPRVAGWPRTASG